LSEFTFHVATSIGETLPKPGRRLTFVREDALTGYPVSVWTDYLCPWAYASRSQNRWLRAQGIVLEIRPFELHPELPVGGRTIPPGSRYDRLLDRLGEQCRDRGLDFVKPSRTPNTRRALELLELLNLHHPSVVPDYDAAIAKAVWVDGVAIDEPGRLDGFVGALGVDVDDLNRRLDLGEGAERLEAARSEAIGLEVAGTPSWRIGDFTLTGLHDDAQFRRWVVRIIERRRNEGDDPANGGRS
jgi:2-hydroxychromene-2-carboxylate isomerase